jgi:NAD dependent epimerase/dehydratase
MDLPGKRVLVTGAGGFIGSHLVEALVDCGCDLTAMVHYDSRSDLANLDLLPADKLSRVKVLAGNVEDPFFVNAMLDGIDVVFHLAALIAIPHSYVAPASYVRTNVDGTLNVLEAARARGTGRVVIMSTSEVYGTARYAPINEEHPLQAQSPYSATKIAAEKLAESYRCAFGLPVVVVRAFNTFGPRQSARAVIPTIISQQLFSDSVRVGSLTPTRDFLFVKDTALGLMAIAGCDEAMGQVLNLGTGREASVADILDLVQRLTGSKKPVEVEDDRVRPKNSEVLRLLCDSSKARKMTGWAPRFDLEGGLRETIDFVRANSQRFRVGSYAR